jgi:hypothetical protein
LPLKRSASESSRISIPFTLTNKKPLESDPRGIVVGGAEKSIMKMCVLQGDTLHPDTIRNAADPGFMLHGQWRLIEYDTSYSEGIDLVFKAYAVDDRDMAKMWVTQSGKSAILKDTSTSVNKIIVCALEKAKVKIGNTVKNVTTRVMVKKARSRKIALHDVKNTVLKISTMQDQIVGVCIEKDPSQLLQNEERGEGVIVDLAPGVEIYENRTISQSTRLFPLENESNNERYRKSFLLRWVA